jgi:hypothetical protein
VCVCVCVCVKNNNIAVNIVFVCACLFVRVLMCACVHVLRAGGRPSVGVRQGGILVVSWLYLGVWQADGFCSNCYFILLFTATLYNTTL